MADEELPEKKADILDHIERQRPPWQREPVTECGRRMNDVKALITRDEAVAKFKRLGRQRASFSTCMTCVDRTNHAMTWEQNPMAVVHKYAERGAWGRWENRQDASGQIASTLTELRALGLLVDAHREEFENACRMIEGSDDLGARRAAKRRETR